MTLSFNEILENQFLISNLELANSTETKFIKFDAEYGRKFAFSKAISLVSVSRFGFIHNLGQKEPNVNDRFF